MSNTVSDTTVQPPVQPSAALSAQIAAPTRTVNLWSDALYRFARNAMAVSGLTIIVILVLAAVFAPFITPASYDEIKFMDQAYAFPSSQHWMGVDALGRDFFSRIVYGARISLTVGFLATAIATLIGLPLGAAAGYFGGFADWLVLRLVEILSVVPPLLIAILIMTLLGAGLENVLIAIGLTSWINVCRLVRGQILTLRENEYVIAARLIGARPGRIVTRHLLPNSLAPLIVATTLSIPMAIMTEAGLSFLGVGVNPPTPSWGQMINEGLSYMRYYWHLALFPTVMVAITMLAFAFVGDGLRDALDPTLRT